MAGHDSVDVGPGPYASSLVANQTAAVSVGATPRTGTEGGPRVFDGTFSIYDTFNGVRTLVGTMAAKTSITGGIQFAAGEHQVEAIYPGNDDYARASATTTFTVLPDGSIDAYGIGLSRSTFYPYKDGYYDTITIKGTRGEKIAVTAKVYNSSGKVVRSLWATGATGPYAIEWNGRYSSGTQVPAGKYRVVQALKDTTGHVMTVTKYVNVSSKRLYWYSKTLTKYGDSYCCAVVDDGDLSTRDSAFYRGLLVDGNQYGSSAYVGYAFFLVPATRYGNFSFKVLGRSPSGRGTAQSFFNRYVPSDWDGYKTIGRSYGWYTSTVASTGHWNTTSRRVTGYVYASGWNLGAFDVSRVQLLYKYAILK